MSAQPETEIGPPRGSLPDYLPARMINEHVYCPRLFYFEQVEGVFVDNEHTVEGSVQHKRVDKEGKSAPKPDEESEEPVVVRLITLSSEEHKVIAKLDLAEFDGGRATPVDYKHGRPMKSDDGVEVWPSDRVQMAVQGLVLRANAIEATRASSSIRRHGRGFGSGSMTRRWPGPRGRLPMHGRRRPPPKYRRLLSTLPSAPAAPWSASACRTRPGT